MAQAAKLRPEEERMLRALLRRADALNTACVVIELEEWGGDVRGGSRVVRDLQASVRHPRPIGVERQPGAGLSCAEPRPTTARRNMSEAERHLKLWPCGCREWTVATVVNATIEDEVTERFEPCADYRGLQVEYEEIEMENAGHVSNHGYPDASSLTRLESVAGEMEDHHNAAYEVQILEA